MKNILNLSLIAALTMMAGPALAGDAAAGQSAFSSKGCAGCHGDGGASPTAPNYPKLAGKSAADISTALKEFKSGKRPDPTMQAMVAGLTDADIANIAAYIGGGK